MSWEKIHTDKNWAEIIEDYYCGMSERELERKYDVPIRTIYRYIRFIMSQMITSPSSIIRVNWDEIVKDINKIKIEGCL